VSKKVVGTSREDSLDPVKRETPHAYVEGLIFFFVPEQHCAVVRGLEVSQGYVIQYQLIQAQLRYQALQLGVLSLKLLQSPGLIHLKTSIFLTPTELGLLHNPRLITRLRVRAIPDSIKSETVQFELEPSSQEVMRRRRASSGTDYDSAQQSAGAGKICGEPLSMRRGPGVSLRS
jgi:hypothetical protein